MPASGERLGVYQIVASIGAGGMGEVFRARDTTLERDVAIKILPDSVAADPLRVARFEREARLLAALNHPHIAAIYGVGESGSTHFLVLELVDGEPLSARIGRERIPLAETLAIARQIASALEAAHEKGIVHRDLKPANVMLSADGQVKVLDFGLARHEAAGAATPENAITSPTLTVQATAPGVILGTAAYMSPEQAKGRVADKRSDVWAFAAVIFEMLSGKRAFEGEDISETLAAIIRGEPDWSALPADTPSWLVATLKRCLDKDRRTRIPDVAAVRFLIDEAPSIVNVPKDAGAPAPPRMAPWFTAAALGAALIGMIAVWAPRALGPHPIGLRASVDLGSDLSVIAAGLTDVVALSPDGSILTFVAQKASSAAPQLFIRRLDNLQPSELAGTEGAHSPFFSPDGRWIAFFTASKLKKVAVSGGAVVTICDVVNGRGGAWTEDDAIVYGALGSGTSPSGLLRISSAGGKSEVFSTPIERELTHRWPQVLPNRKGVLFTSSDNAGAYADANLAVRLPSGQLKIVERRAYHGRYIESGHLIFMRDGALFAESFSLERLEVSGQPVPVLDGVSSNSTTGAAQFSVSAAGSFAYLTGVQQSGGVTIEWFERSGKTTPLRPVAAAWYDIRFAPDGRRLAFSLDGHAWIYEWARDTLMRVTTDAAVDNSAVWTPDAKRIAYASARGDGAALNVYWQAADGTGEVQRLTTSSNQQTPASWHPNGRFLAFEERDAKTALTQIMILPMEGNDEAGWKAGTPAPFQHTTSMEFSPAFSPDGRWLAYTSNESGRYEVYVRPFHASGGRTQISNNGGNFATWSRTRSELFYAVASAQIMVVPFTVEGDTFRAEKPRLWSDARFGARVSRMFDLHPDGERFGIAPAPDTTDTGRNHITLVLDFFAELKHLTASHR